MWRDFGEYILSEVGDKKVTIAEIAVGKFDKISKMLESKENITLIKTDINPNDESVIKDDITNPNLELYENVDLIYSIRPPSELQPHLVNLAKEIDAELIIKPLTGEDLNTPRVRMELKNYNKASFYILK
ncbi:UPF0146 family protein [uncultured Methanobrevibacter sp.]|uniref:UPF0146 family protein n=1 Tax=uncultured Methanobrevibacter sp. TaxID=253161 RepID=UPI002619681C|nr:UPF0146 family protein [uncultured Methanobrevibacter sp.]